MPKPFLLKNILESVAQALLDCDRFSPGKTLDDFADNMNVVLKEMGVGYRFDSRGLETLKVVFLEELDA